jgi:hypothetical protein
VNGWGTELKQIQTAKDLGDFCLDLFDLLDVALDVEAHAE